MTAPEDLGPLEAWQIREFPRDLRQAIVAEAKNRRMSPGEFATKIFLAARDAGWDGFAASPDSPPVRPRMPVDDLCKLTEAAAKLAEHGDAMPKGLRANLARGLREAARERVMQRPPQPKALQAPEKSGQA